METMETDSVIIELSARRLGRDATDTSSDSVTEHKEAVGTVVVPSGVVVESAADGV